MAPRPPSLISAWVIVPGVGKDDLDPLCGRDRGHVPHHRRWAVTWKSLLPPELLRLPEQLARVDALLDDPVFFAPFAPFFHPVLGRPCTPVGCYLRLMFLKFRHRLGYESLCAEVSDSISWRRFCRIGLDGQVPHPTALMKLTMSRVPEATVGLAVGLQTASGGAGAAFAPAGVGLAMQRFGLPLFGPLVFLLTVATAAAGLVAQLPGPWSTPPNREGA